MSVEQLQQAYQLIQNDQQQAAIDILEPFLKDHPNNEDAWWLFANATDNHSQKREALNKVLALSSRENRLTKARIMREQLDDTTFDFDIQPATPRSQSPYRALDRVTPPTKRGLSCANIILLTTGIIGMCACVTSLAFYFLFGDMRVALTYPESFGTLETITVDETINDDLTTQQPVDGFLYQGTADETIQIVLSTEADFAPIIVVFDEAEQPIEFMTPGSSQLMSLNFTPPDDAQYTITVRAFNFIGMPLGFDDYELTIQSQ